MRSTNGRRRILSVLPLLLICTAFVLLLTSCGGGAVNNNTVQPEPEKHKVGEKVSTDLVELTPNSMQFAYALYDTGYVPSVEDPIMMPKTYDPEEDKNNRYVAPKGSVIVAIDMTVTNLDRTELELDKQFQYEFATVEYDGKAYPFDKKKFENVEYGHIKKFKYGTNERNELVGNNSDLRIKAAETETIRTYYVLPFEPKSLDDSMKVTFTLPKSDGSKESFVYEK